MNKVFQNPPTRVTPLPEASRPPPLHDPGPVLESDVVHEDTSWLDLETPNFKPPAGSGSGKTAPRYPGRAVDPAYENSLLADVAKSSLMHDLLKRVGNPDVNWSDKATYMAGGRIFLNAHEPEHLGAFLHELHHLDEYERGIYFDPKRMTRDEFVAAKMEGEVRAHAGAFAALYEMGNADYENLAGYQPFRRWLAKVRPELARPSDDPGVARVQAEVVRKFAAHFVRDVMNEPGSRYSASTGGTHAEHYGATWDRSQ